MQYPQKNMFTSSPPLQKILTWSADSSRLSLQQQVPPPEVCGRQNRIIAEWRVLPALVQTQSAPVPRCCLAFLTCGVSATLNLVLALHHQFHVQSWDNALSHVPHAISECSCASDCPRVQVKLCFLLQTKSKSVLSLH